MAITVMRGACGAPVGVVIIGPGVVAVSIPLRPMYANRRPSLMADTPDRAVETFAEAWRSAAESSRFDLLETRYTTSAAHEGWLPGGLRRANGPAACAAALERDFGLGSRLDSWQEWPDGSFEAFFTRADGTRHSRYHLIRIVDGLVDRHWTYPQGADVIGPGLSGSVIRRIEQPDGSVIVEKEISPTRDWIARATNDRSGREAALWVDGTLRELPACLDYPVLDVLRCGDGWTIRMRDVTASLFKDERATVGEWKEVIACLHELHDRHQGRPPAGLCSVGERLALFSERTALAEIDGVDLLPKFSQHGWTLLRNRLPSDLSAPFHALADDPSPLLRALEGMPATMIHGDANAGNLGLEDGRVIALDWGLTCRAPAELEFAWMLGWTEDRDELLEVVRATLGPRVDPITLELAMLYNALFWFPNLAWSAETSSSQSGASARAQLDWWIPHVRTGLHALAGR
jgi:hypothetical protein